MAALNPPQYLLEALGFDEEPQFFLANIHDFLSGVVGMGGGKTFERLKAIAPGVKVRLSSGYSLDVRAREIIQRGCVGFLQKPFSLDQLATKIQTLTAQPRRGLYGAGASRINRPAWAQPSRLPGAGRLRGRPQASSLVATQSP